MLQVSNPEVIAGLLAIVGSGGAAWAGVKTALNGTRERVVRMERRQDDMGNKIDDIRQVVTRLETQEAMRNTERTAHG